MRNRRPRLAGLAAAALLTLALVPVPASAAGGIADAVPSLASTFQKPFIPLQPRPDERSRPTDEDDPNRNAYSVPEATRSPLCGPNFCVHWVGEGLDAPSPVDDDANGLPDYVEEVLRVAEHVHEVENERLGWREPKGDGRRGGGRNKTDVYLAQIGGELFGYAAPDSTQAMLHPIPRRLYGYLVLDNDYSPFEFPGTDSVEDLRVTVAHEYNHILQFGYDAFQDPWFAESSATWMEDQVYNGINDYLRYVRRWIRRTHTPLTAASIKEYGSAVWNQWLARHYGGGAIVRQAWARSIRSRPGGFSVNSYENAIRAAGPSSLSRDFVRFAAAVAEWRTGRGFRESRLFPDMPRYGSLRPGAAPLRRELDHTTFELIRVRARGRAFVLHLTAPGGVAAGVALVGRIGTERDGRTLTRVAFRRGGGRLAVRIARPGRFDRLTAVVVNADARANGFSARRVDWRYLTDRLPFEISADLVR